MFKYRRFIIYYTSMNYMCVFFIKTEHFITTTINYNMEKYNNYNILFTYIIYCVIQIIAHFINCIEQIIKKKKKKNLK